MRPLVKNRTTVLVIVKKYRSQWKMCVKRVLKTNTFHLQMEKLWGGISVWGVPNASEILHRGITQDLGLLESGRMILLKVKTILSMMVIIIALSIRIRSYRYCMRLSRRSHGCATKTSYDTILCYQYLWARILILHCKLIALSGMEDFPCEAFRGEIRIFYSSSFYGLNKVEYRWFCSQIKEKPI